MKPEIGKDYRLQNKSYLDDRSRDRRVRIIVMDRKVFYLETEPSPGGTLDASLSFSRTSMRRLVMPVERQTLLST